jgi:hypothetical protein
MFRHLSLSADDHASVMPEGRRDRAPTNPCSGVRSSPAPPPGRARKWGGLRFTPYHSPAIIYPPSLTSRVRRYSRMICSTTVCSTRPRSVQSCANTKGTNDTPLVSGVDTGVDGKSGNGNRFVLRVKPPLPLVPPPLLGLRAIAQRAFL